MSARMLTGGTTMAETASPRTGNRVCAIVVTYRPDAQVPAHIEAILRQVARVIVVDNEATAESRSRLSSVRAHAAVEVIENRQNEGIAFAFNQGVQRAFVGDFEWVATFDQDSHAPAGFVAALLAAHRAEPDRERVAIVAPVYRDRYLNFVYSPAGGPITGRGQGNARVPVTASSGNLVSSSALRAVGGFREDFFMACVDFEFCLRCRRAGWLVLEVRSVTLDHSLGRYRQRRWLWFNPRINDYDAGRRYFQARNLMILYSKYGAFDPQWLLRDASWYAADLLKLVMFCEDRGPKIRAVVRGVYHGLIGKSGRNTDQAAGKLPPAKPAVGR